MGWRHEVLRISRSRDHSFLGVRIVVSYRSKALTSTDVLAGMMTSFIAQGVDPYRAACIAVRLHGHAAIAAMEALTPLCVTSEDVAQFISVGARNMMMTENGDE